VSDDHDARGLEDPVELRDHLFLGRSIHLLSPVDGRAARASRRRAYARSGEALRQASRRFATCRPLSA
jgi:hypothetical protein